MSRPLSQIRARMHDVLSSIRRRAAVRWYKVGFAFLTICLIGAAKVDGLSEARAAIRHYTTGLGLALPPTDPDTVVFFGPQQFVTVNTNEINLVESFSVPPAAAPGDTAWRPAPTQYTIRLTRVGGSLTNALVKINGTKVASAADFASVSYIERPITLSQTNPNTNSLTLSLKGAAGAGLVVTVVGIPNPTFTIFGPKVYTKTATTPTIVIDNFVLPAGASAPYTISAKASVAGTKAAIKVNGAETIEDIDWGSGVTSVVRTTSLLSGSNMVRVAVRGTTGTTITVTITATDKTPPTLTIAAPPPNFVTNANSVTVSGTSQDRERTQVKVNGVIATMSGPQNTQYSASVPLVEGANSIAIRATDNAGNHTDSTRTVTRDTQAPTLTVTSPADGSYTNQDAATVAGTVTDATTVTVKVNGVSYSVGEGGAFSGSYQLAAGANFLTIEATDAGGNVTSQVRKVTQAKEPPVLTVTAPNEGFAKNTTPLAVSGTVTGTTPITVSVNGVGMTVSGSSFSGGVPLTEGANDIAFTATDPAGNVTVVHRTGRLDTHAPVLTLSAPSDASYSNATTTTVTGTATDESAFTVTVNGTTVTVNTGGSFSQSIPLVPGANTITVTATDASTNATTVTRAVTQDRDPPVPSISTPNGVGVTTPYSNADALTVTVTVVDASPTTVALNGVPVLPDPSGSYVGSAQLTEGVNDIQLTVTDAANNSDSRVLHVIRDTQAPTIDVSAPAEGAHFTTEPVVVSGTVHDATADSTHLTVNGAEVPGSPVDPSAFNFSTNIQLATGTNAITLVATDGAGNTSTATRTVTFGGVVEGVPPDPATVAPPLDPTVATTTFAATAFLYSGSNPIQTGVVPGTIQPLRSAVVRGTVKARTGSGLPGVKVTVLNHPEFGQTISRADGYFDLVVNGGGLLTINYEKAGFLPAQRQVVASWQEYTQADLVTLVNLDPVVTTIDFSQPAQAAQGSVVTDESGTRQATMIFKGGTNAALEMPDGTTQPLNSISVRATEYTVGPTGQSAMPAPLPPTSGYTYAVELSADEAIAAGATGIVFDQPVAVYVDNFLHFPIGKAAPVGSYDRAKAQWRASPNGRIVKVLQVANGRAALDIDGSGSEATPEALVALGVTEAELAQLGSLYAPGKSFWRVQLSHFSTKDINWAFRVNSTSKPPKVDKPDKKNAKDKDCPKLPGSIIGCERQTLGESIGIAGTSIGLNYQSDGSPGYKEAYSADITLIGDTVPVELQRIEVEIRIAGRLFTQTFGPQPSQTLHFVWDGKDAYGRSVQGTQAAQIRIGYSYPANSYAEVAYPNSNGDFGAYGDSPLTGDLARFEVTLWQEIATSLGTRDTRAEGLGGWSIGVHHSYDPVAKVLHLGDGSRRSAAQLPYATTTVASKDCVAYNDFGYCAIQAHPGDRATDVFLRAQGMGVASDGTMYLADGDAFKIWRVNAAGTLEHIAGNGSTEFNGDGIPATSAGIYPEGQLRVGPDNSVYFVDYSGDGRIRRVDKNGIITTAAGTGVCGDSVVTGIPATQADLCVYNFTLAKDGTLYVLDGTEVYRIGADGIITRVVGDGTYARCPATGPSYTCAEGKQANAPGVFNSLNGMAVGPDGSLYLANGEDRVFSSTVIYRIGPDGIIRRMAGNGNRLISFLDRGNGGPATDAVINAYFVEPAIGPDGTLYFVGDDGYLTHVDQTGVLSLMAGCIPFPAPVTCVRQGGERATLTSLSFPRALDFGPDGRLYILDNFARRIDAPLPSLATGDVTVASEDGSELYVFNASGKHLTTVDALVGNPIYTFAYNPTGLLSTITDAGGNTTTVERDGTGSPTAIVAPFGQRTQLTLDGGKYLATVMRPGEPATVLTYSADGLLKTFTDGNGNRYEFTYDLNGLLVRDADPVGGFKTLVRALTDSSSAVTVTTALGTSLTRSTTQYRSGATQRTVVDRAGLATNEVTASNGTVSLSYPDSTRTTISVSADPRFAMQSPILAQMTTRTPGGLVATVTSGRSTVLSDAANPLSLQTLVDSSVVDGQVFRSTYVAATRTFTAVSPMGRFSTRRFDALGRIIEETSPEIAPIQYQYDARGRLSTMAQGSRQLSYTYDTQGRLATVTDPLSRSSQYSYDAADRLTHYRLTDGREIQYSYDSIGNLVALTPPDRQPHQFNYNSANLLTSYNPPSVGTGTWATTYSYDLDGRLAQATRPDGQIIGFGYDAAGRQATTSMPNGVVRYTYSPGTGNLSSISGPDAGAISFSYDGPLLTAVAWAGEVQGSVTATYNNLFQVTGLSVNGRSAIGLSYDTEGSLRQAGALVIERNANNGAITGTDLDGLTTSQSYTVQGELNHYTAKVGATAIFDVSYTRDAGSRITDLTETVNGTTVKAYNYDLAGRLLEVRENGTLTAAYEYDANGNRVRFTGPNGTVSGVYDAQDRLNSYGNATYTYTRNGELNTKTVGNAVTQYEYDVMGRLRSVALSDGTLIEYVIDGMNRRVGRKVNGSLVQAFLYEDQLKPVAELDGAGSVVSEFVYGSKANAPDYMIKDGVKYRIVTDHLGSVRLVVRTSDGIVVQRLAYDEFGRQLVNTNQGFQPFGYAGGLTDQQTGLVRFGARDYDAEVGRFTSKDPSGLLSGENLYVYASGDVVNRIDPSGLCDCDKERLKGLNSANAEFTLKDPASNPNGVEPYFTPGFASKLESAIQQMNKKGVSPQINAGFRTAADQAYEREHSKYPAAKGTSLHQVGLAVDLQPGPNISTNSQEFETVVRPAMKAAGFDWGGRFNDRPHFFLPDPKSNRKAAAKLLDAYFKECINPNAI